MESTVAKQSWGSKVVPLDHGLPPSLKSRPEFCSDLDRQADEPVALSGDVRGTASVQPIALDLHLGFRATSDHSVACGTVSQGIGHTGQCLVCASPLAVAEHVCHQELSVLSHAVCPLCVDQVGWVASSSRCRSEARQRQTLVLSPTACEVGVQRHCLDSVMSAERPCDPSLPEGPNPNLHEQVVANPMSWGSTHTRRFRPL